MARDQRKWCPTCQRKVPANRWWELTGLCSSCSQALLRKIRLRADRMAYRQGHPVQ